MEHLSKILSGLEPSTREHVNIKNMKFLRKKSRASRSKSFNEWDNYYLVTGFIMPKREIQK